MMFLSFSQVCSEHHSEIEKGIEYLKAQSQDAWTTMTLAAANEQSLDLAHLQSAPESQKSVTTYAKYILALTAAGENPTTFGNEDYVAALKSYFNNEQFGDPALLNDDVWAILALGSIGQENSSQVESAKNYLLAWQNQDNGWGYATSADSDTNSTASAIMALLEAGLAVDSAEIVNAVAYLQASQNSDGGFPYSPISPWGTDSDASSDSWVISAIYKLGYNPESWVKNGHNPIEHLITLQASDGYFQYQEGSGEDPFSPVTTSYALLALLSQRYPLQTARNLHHLLIEGADSAICDTQVHGATPLEMVINGSQVCGYDYTIEEYAGLGLYLAEMAGETGWMYEVNETMPAVGASDYYLAAGDEVLWYLFEAEQEQPDASQTVGLQVEIEGSGEPPSGDGGESQTSISFSLSPDSLDFGKLKAGQNSFQSLTFANGSYAVDVEAEVAGDDVFKNNLAIDNVFWQFFSQEISATEQRVFEIKLSVPDNYSGDLGIKQGELTFWAYGK